MPVRTSAGFETHGSAMEGLVGGDSSRSQERATVAVDRLTRDKSELALRAAADAMARELRDRRSRPRYGQICRDVQSGTLPATHVIRAVDNVSRRPGLRKPGAVFELELRRIIRGEPLPWVARARGSGPEPPADGEEPRQRPRPASKPPGKPVEAPERPAAPTPAYPARTTSTPPSKAQWAEWEAALALRPGATPRRMAELCMKSWLAEAPPGWQPPTTAAGAGGLA